MNNKFYHILISTTKWYYRKALGRESDMPNEKELRNYKITVSHLFMNFVFTIFGILSAGFGLKGFILPNSYIDGGVTGISLLISLTTKIPFPLLILIINIPFLLLGLRQINRAFVLKSFFSIIGLALFLALVDFPVITHDKLLTAVFGGFFLGAGIGLAIRGGSVIDGTEILAIYLSEKFGSTIGDIIWIINIIIFSFAAYFLSVEIALYSILIYLSASKTADFIIEGIEEYIGVTIISNHIEEIRNMIIETLGHGVTIYSGKSGYSPWDEELNEIEIIYTLITRLEIGKLKSEIEKIDGNAFIVLNNIREAKGGVIKKRTIKDK